jgi:hypothetical protein
MSRPVSSMSLTIDLNKSIDQEKSSEINQFKKSLKPNERVLVNTSGTQTIYSRHRESRAETLSRKLDNFQKNMKAAFSVIQNCFMTKTRGDPIGNHNREISHIKSPPANHSLTFEKSSISVRKFGALKETNTIPVLGELEKLRADGSLKKLHLEFENYLQSTDVAVNSQNIKKSTSQFQLEAKAFSSFLGAQADGQVMQGQLKEAINFANRLMNLQLVKENELTEIFGIKDLGHILQAAFALQAFSNS